MFEKKILVTPITWWPEEKKNSGNNSLIQGLKQAVQKEKERVRVSYNGVIGVWAQGALTKITNKKKMGKN